MSISKINGVATDDVVKVDGVAVADIVKVDGIEWPSATAYLLDTYTDATLAYSFRQLKTGVTNCIDVVNSSNVTATIGFSGGYLDTAALDAHCGVGSGTISRWYDQSGNSNNATQSTASRVSRLLRRCGQISHLSGTSTHWRFLCQLYNPYRKYSR